MNEVFCSICKKNYEYILINEKNNLKICKEICCPYCGQENITIITNLSIKINKLDKEDEDKHND